MDEEFIKEIEEEIANLKARWPAHSVPPKMYQQLEELEEKLEEAKNSFRQMTEGIFNTKQAHILDNTDRINEIKPFELFKNIVKVTKGMTCIDFGCGTGILTLQLAEMVGNEGKIYAVDNSAEMLKQVRLKNPPPNIIMIQEDVAQTGLNGQIADICLLSSILHEVKRPSNLITEAYRLLKPEGRVVVIEFKMDSKSPSPPKKVRISEEQLGRLFEQVGLSFINYIDWSKKYYVAIGVK
jgi:2-polyprenyl-3-methyl-5-hydroxy-6-metoxy-1,4-benzoquinol methylase